VYLHGAGPKRQSSCGMRITALEIECVPRCHGQGDGADGVRHFTSESVFIHEPKTRLYDSCLWRASMPLRSDLEAGFSLIRIPGGRLLLESDRAPPRGTASTVVLFLL